MLPRIEPDTLRRNKAFSIEAKCPNDERFGPDRLQGVVYSDRKYTEETTMNEVNRKKINSFSLLDVTRARIAAFLYKAYSDSEGLLGGLDCWTQRRITEENLAKLALVLDADDPVEACYRDLIREIDNEAETGIYLARSGARSRHLQRVMDEPGVSGELHRELQTIAPNMFADEVARSTDELDLVWITIRACHDRAHVDASVSEIIMAFLVDDRQSVRDMSNAMRALHYAYHEDAVRRRCDLPPLTSDTESRELVIMVTELADRSGSYEKRVTEIRGRADTR